MTALVLFSVGALTGGDVNPKETDNISGPVFQQWDQP